MMIGLPQEFATLIGLLEVIGGVLLVVGLLTRFVALLFAIEMVGAFIILNISTAIVLPKGYEFGLLSIPILLLAICLHHQLEKLQRSPSLMKDMSRNGLEQW